MRAFLLSLALLGTLASPALADRGGGGGGEPAIANETTTSMGEPLGSPGLAAPRSAAIPGSPANLRAIRLGQDPALVARCGTFHPTPGCRSPLP